MGHRTAALLAGLALALPAAAPAAAPAAPVRASHELGTMRGVVQRVRPARRRLLLRTLDGTATWLLLALRGQVRVNGARGSLGEIRPGFVAEARLNARGRVGLLSAYGRVPLRVDRGEVSAVTPTAITIVRPGPVSLTLAIGPSTRFVVRGRPASAGQVLPGMRAAVAHRGGAPATRVAATLPRLVVTRGVLQAVSPSAVVVRTAAGRVLTLAVGPTTAVRIGRRPADLTALRAGQAVAVAHRGAIPATRVRVLAGSG